MIYQKLHIGDIIEHPFALITAKSMVIGKGANDQPRLQVLEMAGNKYPHLIGANICLPTYVNDSEIKLIEESASRAKPREVDAKNPKGMLKC